MKPQRDKLIPPHGGYRQLKTFQLAELIYDVTVRFCDLYVDKRSRTHDQMVQAARSGARNISEGSVDSATSKKSELKLTGIARGSLVELTDDYKAFLRQRELEGWPPAHPALVRFRERKCATLHDIRAWVRDERQRARAQKAQAKSSANPSVKVRACPCPSVPSSAQCVANAALSLLNVCLRLLGRQMEAQADAFERDGGFTERLYRVRSEKRFRNTRELQ